MRFGILTVSNPQGRELQRASFWIGRRDGEQPERAATLCERFVSLYFTFHSAGRTAHAIQSADKNHERRTRRFALNKECVDARSPLCESDVPAFGCLHGNDRKGNNQEGDDNNAHGKIIYVCRGGVTIMRAHE